MNEFLLKDDEVMIFTDFNNTLVDFENEYNSAVGMYAYEKSLGNRGIKGRVSHALKDFELLTGFKPVICVVTNASLNAVDSNGSFGIAEDLYMTFLITTIFQMKKQEKFMKILVKNILDIWFIKKMMCFLK